MRARTSNSSSSTTARRTRPRRSRRAPSANCRALWSSDTSSNGGLGHRPQHRAGQAAQGEYLTFLDGDDWLAPGYLHQLLDAIESAGLRLRAHRPRPVHRPDPQGHPGAARPPRGGDVPARGDPARRPLHLGRLPVRLGRHLPPPAHRQRAAALQRTGCAPPRTGRGSGGCTARRSLSPSSACSASSTAAGSPPHSPRSATCGSSISSAAFDQVIAETATDRGGGRAAAEGRAHLLRDHRPPHRRHRQVRARRGPQAACDERGGHETHAAGRPRATPWTRWTTSAPPGCAESRRRPVTAEVAA